MKATLREYMGTEERDRRSLQLLPDQGPVTIGRSESCTHTIGKTLGQLALGISKVQATITFNETQIALKDGGVEGVSTNGIYNHNERVKGAIVLVPGLELVLFKHGIAKVTLVVSEALALVEYGKDTYTGQDLLSVLQEQQQAMTGQLEALHLQVSLLGDQITQRETIDNNQERRLFAAEQRLNRVVMYLLSAIAVIVLVFGWSGGNSEEKKRLSSTITSVAIALAVAYLKSKEIKLPIATS